MKGRLAFVLYKSGEKDRATELFTEAITTLKGEERNYEVDVWLSGAHMRAAEALIDDDKNKAQEHLNEAKAIIDSNEKLSLRREQWEKLSAKF